MYGYTMHQDSIPKTVLQGTLDKGRQRGRQTKSWMDNIKEWTQLGSPSLIRLTGQDQLASVGIQVFLRVSFLPVY